MSLVQMEQRKNSLLEYLIWQMEAGVDECIGDTALNWFADTPTEDFQYESSRFDQKVNNQMEMNSGFSDDDSSISGRTDSIISQSVPKNITSDVERTVLSAIAISEAATSIPDLKLAVENFDACKLKKTAINTVFADGEPSSKIMLIGGVPGVDEDRKGLPFIGSSGQFLDKMLSSINLDRSCSYITNLVFWRPPGDREPTSDEIAVCIPFVKRHIELASPEILVLLGGSVSKTLLGMKEGITKIHGQWFEYSTPKMGAPISAIPLFHPENLLSSLAYKSDAWCDLLKIKEKLSNK